MVFKSVPATPYPFPTHKTLSFKEPPTPPEDSHPAPSPSPSPSPAITCFDMRIVLNIYRSEDHCVREIVSLRDLVPTSDNCDDGDGGDGDGPTPPSWSVLLGILRDAVVDDKAVFDPEKDMMLFDECLCVCDERQFLAAMQWIANDGAASRNVNVPVHGSDSESRRRLWVKS